LLKSDFRLGDKNFRFHANFSRGRMAGERTSSTIFARTIVNAAVRLGADKAELLERVGISPDVLDAPETRVPTEKHIPLLEESARMTGDEHIGLRAGEWVSPDPANTIYYLFLNSPTMGEGIVAVGKYFRLYSDTAMITIEREGENLRLGIGSSAVVPEFSRHVMEWTLATWLTMGRKYAGDTFCPIEVRFWNPPPEDDSELTRFFRAPLVFGYPRTEMVFPVSIMAIPHRNGEGDPVLLKMLQQHVEQQIEQLAGVDPFLHALREEVSRRLNGEKFDLSDVARALGMSGRSLQRKLKENNTSYREVLEARQKEAAIDDLRDYRLSLLEVSHRLGFSSQGAFYEAFHRWYGTTPAEFRRMLTSPSTLGEEPPN